ncbi:MAG: peptidoglycan editing factor PgeF [Gammaproteobacteria bacterium]
MTPRAIIPNWPAADTVGAASTERAGGISQGAYADLNLGSHVGDDAQAVARNREIVVSALELPNEPSWLEQVHGTDIVDLDTTSSRTADGAVTSTRGRVCVILTADCLPVLLTNATGDRIGAAHAGWRGLANGVLPAAVASMGGDPSNLMAWLGPAIGPGAYEVGGDVRDEFIAADSEAKKFFEPNANGRWQADLYGLARLSLNAAGVDAIYDGGFCTATESDRFFSHRREAPCGRMATLIWTTP